MLTSMHREQSTIITAWYALDRGRWRWYCGLCNEEHATTAIEADYDGPVLTAIYGHTDLAHPGIGMEIEVKSADGDPDDGD